MGTYTVTLLLAQLAEPSIRNRVWHYLERGHSLVGEGQLQVYSSIRNHAVHYFHGQVIQWVCNPPPQPISIRGRGRGAALGAPVAGRGCVPTDHPNPEGIAPVTRE